jgi:hypothetical protein
LSAIVASGAAASARSMPRISRPSARSIGAQSPRMRSAFW